MDNIPFDDLDPCCQKEVLANRKEKSIKERLSKQDISNRRVIITKNVFVDVKSRKSVICHSCEQPTDYKLLRQLRGAKVSSPVSDSHYKHNDKSDDSDFEDDMDFVSEYERDLQMKMVKHIEKMEYAKQLGYGIHTEESLNHLIHLVFNLNNSVICHIYNPDSPLCARLDLYLEGIAERYLGTLFRRVNIHNYADITIFGERLGMQIIDPCLLCFSEGVMVASIGNLTQYGSNEVLYASDITQLLEASHVLQDSIPADTITNSNDIKNKLLFEDETDIEVEVESSYCDVRGCSRFFPHTHIGGQGGSSLVMNDQQRGMEALSRNSMTSI
eukprot:gene7522-15402_t